MSENPSVFLVILIWNHLEDTIECLDSVFHSEYRNIQVIIIDNASTDSSVAVIHEKFPQVKIIENKENLGYAEGNNVGIRYALKHEADYVFVLNNDIVIQCNTISSLVNILENNPQAAAVSPISYFYYEPEKVYFAGGYIHENGKVGHVTKTISTEPYPTEWLNGCALLMRSALLRKIGLFESSYFLLFEDVDWSSRARKQGYCLLINPKNVILHKASISFNEQKSYLKYYYIRNYHHWIDRNYPWINRLGLHLNQFLRDISSVKYFVKVIIGYENTHRIIRKAYVDYLLNHLGKIEG